jgi:hypothetical protein
MLCIFCSLAVAAMDGSWRERGECVLCQIVDYCMLVVVNVDLASNDSKVGVVEQGDHVAAMM